jgi:hypothetical protein
MKQYNLSILLILILLTISISSYFFYLDIIYKDKLVKNDVESLYDLKRIAGKPIVVFANTQEIEEKTYDYNQIIQELNIDAIAEPQKETIIIRGEIHNTFSYILLKRLLDIIKNDEVNLISTCVGMDCTDNDYGFLIEIKPYMLKLK